MENEECNNAIKSLFSNINIDEIKTFIDSIDCISKERKYFYKKMVEQRYDILKKIYEKLK